MGEVTNDQAIQGVYQQVRAILTRSRSRAWQAVNTEMVACYWEIGRLIVEEEQRGKARAGYGKYLIKELAERLTKEFGKGFALSNIKYFRQLYLSFSIGHAVRGQLPDGRQIDNALDLKSLSSAPTKAMQLCAIPYRREINRSLPRVTSCISRARKSWRLS